MQQERYDLAVTDEHARESSVKPTRETATGGASRVVLEYGWASLRGGSYPGAGERNPAARPTHPLRARFRRA